MVATVTPVAHKDSAVVRALRTFVQFVIGLVAAVWVVPGVPEAVQNYLQGQFFTLVLAIGVPAGIAAFVWNALRKDVPTT